MDDRKLKEARQIAIKKGIINNPEELQISKAANKRFSIKWLGKTVNFGVWPYSGSGTYLDHNDPNIRKAWQARHSKIKLKDGRFAYKVPGQPEWFSWWILW
jgi:hypothetical protein